MNKIIISNRQFALLISGFMFGSGPLLLSSGPAALAGPDAWLSAVITTVAGLLVIWINSYLGGMYPDKTLIEVIRFVLGKWIGSFISVCYIFFALVTATQVIWYVGDFYTTVYAPEISSYTVNILFIIVLAIALLYGLEAMCRASEMFFIIGFPLLISSMLMLAPNFKPDNLLPMLENGILPVLKGAIPLMSLTVLPLIILNMIFPINTGNLKDAKKSMLKGYLLGAITTFVGVVMCILVLGSEITANLRYPLFTLTREINVGKIFTRVEAIIVFVWLVTNFIAVFFYLYAGIVGLSQLLNLKDHKKIILPMLLIVSVYSGSIYKNVPYEIFWDTYVWPPFIFTFGFVLPSILIIISAIKNSLEKHK